jgi:hypothetical protein
MQGNFLNEELGARIVQCKEKDPRNYEQGMLDARKKLDSRKV